MIWSRAATFLDARRLVLGTFGSRYALYDWHADRWDLHGVAAGVAVNAVCLHDGALHAVGDAGDVVRDGATIAKTGSLCNFLVSSEDRLLTGGQLGIVFDALTGQPLHQHHSPLNCGAAFTRRDVPHVAIGTYTGEVLIFKLMHGSAPELVTSIVVFGNAVKGLASAEGELFAVCASTDIAWIDCETLSLRSKCRHAHEKIVNACTRIGSGSFASVSRDRTLRLWINGECEVYPSPHPNSVKSLCASSDGSTLMSGSYGGTIAGFDVPTRRWTVFKRPTTAGISSIAYDPHARRFAAASYDGSVHWIDSNETCL